MFHQKLMALNHLLIWKVYYLIKLNTIKSVKKNHNLKLMNNVSKGKNLKEKLIKLQIINLN